MLAAFIGFEVIRRVSPLLHTPLMSLTNALDAIAVVGAIILVGDQKSTLATILGTIAIVAATSNIVGGFLITDRMLQDVQKQPPRTKTNHERRLAGSQYVIEVIYLIASALFILSLKWLSSPATARHGILAGEIGMVLAIGGTLFHHGIVDYKWIIIALVLGTVIGIPLGMVQMTAVPQRTALSHAFGALCVTLVGTAEYYCGTPHVPRFMMSVLVDGSDSRLPDLHRQPDGRRKTAGNPAAAPDHLQRTELRQPSAVRGRRRTAPCIWCCIPTRSSFFPLIVGISLDLRRPAGHPHRRRGHADRDLAA